MEDYPSTSFDHCYAGSTRQNNEERTRMPNGEKVRTVQRLRKLIDDLNRLTEEHFMVVTTSEIPDKHLSFYGSRYLIQSAVNSNLKEQLLEEEDFDRVSESLILFNRLQRSIYLPIANTSVQKNEESCSENSLWGKVVNLLNLFNYPSKEHFSYKQHRGHQPKTRPKPSYWPREIKYISLVNTSIQNAFEQEYVGNYVSKKQIIRKVLADLRTFYGTLQDDLKERTCEETKLNKQRVARKRGHYQTYPEDHDLYVSKPRHESLSPADASCCQYPTDSSLRDGTLREDGNERDTNTEKGVLDENFASEDTSQSVGDSHHQEEESSSDHSPKREQEQEPPKQPQLVKTVLVQTPTGPVLRKYVYKLRPK